MEEIWGLLVVGYWVVVGVTIVLILIPLIIPQHIYEIDDVCDDKYEVYTCIIEYIENDFGIKIKRPSILFDYTKNNDLKGVYHPSNHSISLFILSTDSVYSFTLTLIEELHHSVYVSKSVRGSYSVYQLYDRLVGYDNNPLEYSAKIYATSNFNSIHRILKKRRLVRYKV